MVTKATNNIEDKPFIPLDFQAFADKRPHAAGEVRNVLRSRISQVTEVPEEIGGDPRKNLRRPERQPVSGRRNHETGRRILPNS